MNNWTQWFSNLSLTMLMCGSTFDKSILVLTGQGGNYKVVHGNNNKIYWTVVHDEICL